MLILSDESLLLAVSEKLVKVYYKFKGLVIMRLF